MKMTDFTLNIDAANLETIKISDSLKKLQDRDLAKRLTMQYFTNIEKYDSIEILEEFSINVNGETHAVVLMKVYGKTFYHDDFEYLTLQCSHDLIEPRNVHIASECLVKSFANQAKSFEVRNGYMNDPNLYDSDSMLPDWKKGALEFMIIDLVWRFENQEWLGVTPGPATSLYLQHVAEILDFDFNEIDRVVRILVAKDELYRVDNVIRFPWKDDPMVTYPNRPWAEYIENNKYLNLKVHISLPEDLTQLQEFLIKVYKDNELYAFEELPLRNSLNANGQPSDEDRKIVEHWLFSRAEQWRRPYMSPYRMKLDLVDNSTGFGNNETLTNGSEE